MLRRSTQHQPRLRQPHHDSTLTLLEALVRIRRGGCLYTPAPSDEWWAPLCVPSHGPSSRATTQGWCTVQAAVTATAWSQLRLVATRYAPSAARCLRSRISSLPSNSKKPQGVQGAWANHTGGARTTHACNCRSHMLLCAPAFYSSVIGQYISATATRPYGVSGPGYGLSREAREVCALYTG